MGKKIMLKKIVSILLVACMMIAIPSITYASSGNINPSILADSKVLAETIEAEGIVLLKNKNNILPLSDEAKVNIFGIDSINPLFGSSGSGSVSSDNCVGFYDALTAVGIEYNETLYNTYSSYASSSTSEMPISNIDFNQAKEYSDTAIIMIGRAGNEGSDLSISDLQLSANEASLVDKVATEFLHVIVLFNTANIMEMGFVDKYESIEASALIWTTGEVGMTAVGKMLIGEVNPSGKLTDTVAYNISDYSTTVNFGDFSYADKDATFIEYEEGIYVGYRYFETFGIDVQYPFGFGLSYTSFDWQTVDFSYDGDMVSVSVLVTNTGNRAGKEVVEVYVSLPYYQGGIEKSSIQLASYVKTELLLPGESSVVTTDFDLWDVSSYDMNNEAWVLDAGTYTVYTATDVRNYVDTYTFELFEKRIKKYDETTGVEINNLFDDSAYDGLTILSRAYPEITMPTAPSNELCPIDISDMDLTLAPKVDESMEVPTLGAIYNETIYLQDVYQNPSLMDVFLDQLTLDEMISLICDCGYQTPAINRLGVIATNDNDGPASVKGEGGLLYSDSGVAWPAGVCLASTWNDELAYLHGVQCGIEAKSIGTNVWYAPTVNLHRNPMGGRNFEYFSEDPMICGRMATAIVKGAQSQNLTITLKHLVLNEQETNRWGVLTWADEQTIREIYLRPFEKAIKEGKAEGVMTAYNRLGKTWCGSSSILIKNLLREEWGYEDFVISDFSVYGLYGNYMNPMMAVYAQNDAILTGLYFIQQLNVINNMKNEYNANPVAFGVAMRKCAEDILNMKMRTTAFKNYSLSDNTFRIEGETGKVNGQPNKGSSFVENVDGASTGYVLCNLSKKNNVITWTFDVDEAGEYDLTMALANTHLLGTNVKLSDEIKMTLNGSPINVTGYTIKGYGILSFNNFDKYGSIRLNLNKGLNVITWTVIGGDCPNIDYFDFSKVMY